MEEETPLLPEEGWHAQRDGVVGEETPLLPEEGWHAQRDGVVGAQLLFFVPRLQSALGAGSCKTGRDGVGRLR